MLFVALAPLAACAPPPAASTPVPAASSASGGEPTTLLVRLGTDTLAIEQYTRTPTRMEGRLVNHVPSTTIARYRVELLPNSVPARAEYSLRGGDGAVPPGALQSLSVRYGADSVYLVGHRSSGDTMRAVAAQGTLLPNVSGSYGLFELALARLRASGRDSIEFAQLPMSFTARGTTPLAVKLIGTDAARVDFFGSPLILRHDGRGNLLGADGSQTTVRVRVDRVANVSLDTIARLWAARDRTVGAMGPTSPRDTARATIGGAHVMVDYSRPSLRGRNVWVNGVLGDTIWRTGANAATQLKTDADLSIGGVAVPAGTYTLWTRTAPDGTYQLIINKQFGQGGTEYDRARDLARIPVGESTTAAPVERFTIAIAPQGSASGLLTLTWGSKQLGVPVSAK
jgi:hypothetical protein